MLFRSLTDGSDAALATVVDASARGATRAASSRPGPAVAGLGRATHRLAVPPGGHRAGSAAATAQP